MLVCPPGTPQEGGLQPELAQTSDTSSLLPLGIRFGVLSVLFLRRCPLWPGLLLLSRGFLLGGEDVLAQVHGDGVVVGARSGGVDGDQ